MEINVYFISFVPVPSEKEKKALFGVFLQTR
jgi:hypothetical protein